MKDPVQDVLDWKHAVAYDLTLQGFHDWMEDRWESGDEEADVEECPRCHQLCNGDVTISDHGCCIDCLHEQLNENKEDEK